MWHENGQTNGRRDNRSDQNGACRNILRVTNTRIRLDRDRIRQPLYRRVERLGEPDQPDCQDDPTPLVRRQPKVDTDYDNKNGRDGMDPAIVLGRGEMAQPRPGIAEALNALTN